MGNYFTKCCKDEDEKSEQTKEAKTGNFFSLNFVNIFLLKPLQKTISKEKKRKLLLKILTKAKSPC